MQNDPSGSTSRRRDAAQSRFQEASSNYEKDQEAGAPHRTSSVRSLAQRRRRDSAAPGGVESPENGESGPSSQPPAVEYYRSDEEFVSGGGQPADADALRFNRIKLHSLTICSCK